MKRFTVILLSLCLLAVSAAGCGTPKDPDIDDVLVKKGTVTLGWDFGLTMPAWKKVADAYTKLNPEVKIVLNQMDGGNYHDVVSQELNDPNTQLDVVVNNTLASHYNTKFVDYNQYKNKVNPYDDSGKKWSELVDSAAFMVNGSNQEVYSMHFNTVMTSWYFNKDLFKKAGITDDGTPNGTVVTPKNWDELLATSEKLVNYGKSVGKDIYPLAISGNYDGFYAWQMGWLFRVYTDQMFRDLEDEVAAKPGDYCYDAELQENFTLDITNCDNDAEPGYIFNNLRLLKGISDGTWGPSNVRYQEMVTNLAQFFPKYVIPGFSGANNTTAVGYFLRGEAAMWMDLAKFGAGFERTMDDSTGVERFELGTFRTPPMTSENVAVDYTRDTCGASGSLGIIKKSKQQNNLVADFLMFFLSKQGQKILFEEYEALNISPDGPSLVKDVEMPEKWAAAFSQLEWMGQADKNPHTQYSRGLYDVGSSLNVFANEGAKLFSKLNASAADIAAYCNQLQDACQRALGIYMYNVKGYNQGCLDDVTQDPLA